MSSLPPFLPREIRCLARMPHNGRGVYQPTALMAAHYDRIIAVAPRLRDDLVATYGVPPDQVEIIANGVDTERFYPGPEDVYKRQHHESGKEGFIQASRPPASPPGIRLRLSGVQACEV